MPPSAATAPPATNLEAIASHISLHYRSRAALLPPGGQIIRTRKPSVKSACGVAARALRAS